VPSATFESLDYLYLPAPDIEASVKFYTEGLGGELIWRVRDGTTWVAAIRLVEQGPPLLLANHLEPGHGLLIYRVKNLAVARRGTSTAASIRQAATSQSPSPLMPR